MAYGTIKVDTITFTDAGVDKSVTISGLVQNPTFSGNITVTGTVSGNTIQGQTVSGATITGGAAAFTTVTGGVATITSGVFATGNTTNPSISFSGDSDTGIYSPFANQLAITTSGVERVEWGPDEVVFNDGGVNYDFRIEGDTNANLFFVDASADRVGIGTASPAATVHINTTAQYSATNGNTTAGLLISQTGGTPADGAYGTAICLSKINSGRPGGAIASVQTSADDDQLGLAFLVHSSALANDTLTEALRISHAGTATFTASASTAPFIANIGASEAARIDSSGRFLVGTSTARSNFFNAGVTAGLQAESTGEGSIVAAIRNVNDVAAVPVYLLAKSRGTSVGSNTIVQSQDHLGYLSFQGSDGSEFVEAARISGEVDGTPGADDMPGRLVFSTTSDGASSPTERMRITSDAYVRLASGTGGIQFNGDTAAANALDDYEEGTFTPVLTFGGGSTGLTYTLQAGTYTKIGRKVHVIIEILLSAKGSSTGTASIGGLPFTSTARAFAATVNACGSVVFTNGYLSGGVNASATTITLYNTPTSGGIVTLSNTAFTNSTGMRIDATYYV